MCNLVFKQCNLYAKSLWFKAWSAHGNLPVHQQFLCQSLWGDMMHLRVTSSSGCTWRIFKWDIIFLYKSKRQQVCNCFSCFQKVLFFSCLLHVMQRWISFKISFLALISTLHFKPRCFTVEPSLHWLLIKSNCKNAKQDVAISLSCLILFHTFSFHVMYVCQVNLK